jgi:TPR repeat protein
MRDKIFICYRRDDTAAFAALLRERLVDSFGAHRVFVDIDSIGPGIDFVDSITEAMVASALVLVLIGKRWHPERLQDPGDFVRIEIQAALDQKARIVPLLFEDVNMPRPEELPPSLALLTRRHAVEIGTSRLNVEIRTFVEEVEAIFQPKDQRSAASQPIIPPPAPVAPRPVEPPPLPLPLLRPDPAPPRKKTGPHSYRKLNWLSLAAVLVLLGVVAIAMIPSWRKPKPSGGETPAKANRIGITYKARAFSGKYLRERGLPELGFGLEVTGIFPGGPAERTGLVKGDIIRKANGRLLRVASVLDEEIAKLQAGETVMFEVWRGANAMDIAVPVENGFELYQRSCSDGVAMGCLSLGFYYLNEGKDSAQAAALFRQACESGTAEGCRELGFLYRTGEGVPKDLKRAASLYGESCSKGFGNGCYVAGLLFENGEGVEQDPARAANLYDRACSLKERWGCTNLGRLHEIGLGVPQDLPRAALLYEQACDAGDADACNRLGVLHYLGKGVSKDVSRASAYYNVACNGGDQHGCVNLGSIFQTAPEGEQDLARASALYEQACNAGVGRGCQFLGVLYQHGSGKEKDLKRSLELFQKGCDLDDLEACNSAGYVYSFEVDFQTDRAKAIPLFQRACEGSFFLACNNLGVNYQHGNGPEKDEARAAALYKKACEGDAPIGCRNLGSLYEKGLGVPMNPPKAVELYQQACSKGDSPACDRLPKPAR